MSKHLYLWQRFGTFFFRSHSQWINLAAYLCFTRLVCFDAFVVYTIWSGVLLRKYNFHPWKWCELVFIQDQTISNRLSANDKNSSSFIAHWNRNDCRANTHWLFGLNFSNIFSCLLTELMALVVCIEMVWSYGFTNHKIPFWKAIFNIHLNTNALWTVSQVSCRPGLDCGKFNENNAVRRWLCVKYFLRKCLIIPSKRDETRQTEIILFIFKSNHPHFEIVIDFYKNRLMSTSYLCNRNLLLPHFCWRWHERYSNKWHTNKHTYKMGSILNSRFSYFCVNRAYTLECMWNWNWNCEHVE